MAATALLLSIRLAAVERPKEVSVAEL